MPGTLYARHCQKDFTDIALLDLPKKLIGEKTEI